MRRRDGSPVWLAHQQPAAVLKRAELDKTSASGGYSEEWLQMLLFENPAVFPLEQIEPGFGDLVPLCCELPVGLGGNQIGYLDNFFVTQNGGLVLVEVKLWRNPEARRSAVAQAMEYAAAVFRMNYGELETAVHKGCGAIGLPAATIFQLVAKQYPETDQIEFHDAISRNLTRGRAVIAVLGDGIREEMLPLASFVQGHAGHRFTFALIELAVYEVAPQSRVVVPSVLAQTVLIERGVVRIEGDSKQGLKIEVTAAPDSAPGSTASKRISIGEDEFFELLGKKDVAMPDVLRAFLAKSEALGVYAAFKRGLNLRAAAPEGQQPLNMGTINKDGYVDTGPSTWFGRGIPGARYNEALAAAIGGQISASSHSTQEAGIRTAAGKMVRLADLLPRHEQLWLDAMAQYIKHTCAQHAGPEAGAEGNGDPKALEMHSEQDLRKLADERLGGQSRQQLEKLENNGMIDEATDLLATAEGEGAVEEARQAAAVNWAEAAARNKTGH
jgi:hypothetical protein